MTIPYRKLAYKDTFVEEILQQSPECEDCLPIEDEANTRILFPDMTTKVPLTLYINQEQWTQLFTCVMVGADLAYPSEAHNINFIFLKTVECSAMTICDWIVDCIETNPDVLDALAAAMQRLGYGIPSNDAVPQLLPSSETSENLLPEGYTCDDDHLCGMSRWIVTNLNDSTNQLLQQFETATNTWEFLSVFADNVEGVSWVGSLLEFGTWLQDQLNEYYETAWSPAVEDELTCMIYCAVKDTCSISVDSLLNAYSEAVTSSFDLPTALGSISEIFNWLGELDYETGNAIAIVGSFHWFVLKVLSFGAKALEYTSSIRSLEQMIATGADETDTYCASNCDCNENDIYEYDFTVSDCGFTIQTGANRGEWVEGVGFRDTQSSSQTGAWIVKSIPTDWNNSEIVITATTSAGTWRKACIWRNDANSSTGQVISIDITNNVSPFCDYDMATTPFHRDYLLALINFGSPTTSEAVITKIQLRGSGTPPSGYTSIVPSFDCS